RGPYLSVRSKRSTARNPTSRPASQIWKDVGLRAEHAFRQDRKARAALTQPTATTASHKILVPHQIPKPQLRIVVVLLCDEHVELRIGGAHLLGAGVQPVGQIEGAAERQHRL